MKKFHLFLIAVFALFASSVAYGANDIEQVLGEVDTLQNTIEEKTPEELKGVFSKVEAWRIKQADVFVTKRDEQDAILHPESDDKKISINENGDIEIETGIGEAKQNPKAAALFYTYLILAFIFSTVYLFYSVLVLLVLSLLKMIVGALFRKKD